MKSKLKVFDIIFYNIKINLILKFMIKSFYKKK